MPQDHHNSSILRVIKQIPGFVHAGWEDDLAFFRLSGHILLTEQEG